MFNIPVIGSGELDVVWVEFTWVGESTEFGGMSVVFKDVSLEFELSSTTSSVGQDGDGAWDI